MDGGQGKAGFWRRLAAAWVDLFIIYSLSSFIVIIASLLRLHLSIEPAFIVIAAVYGAVFIAVRGQTVGKMLFGMSVEKKSGGAPGWLAAVVREVVGKWGLTVVLPVLLGLALTGRVVLDLLRIFMFILPLILLFCSLLLLLIYYLVARRAWYDQLAGTEVLLEPELGRRRKMVAYALLSAAVLGLGAKAAEYGTLGYVPCRLTIYRSMRPTAPYETFLRQGRADPVDYVMQLFDNHDVVVLCERMHPEASQWDFIFDLVRDPRFIERVGHVATEYGQAGMQASLDSLLSADSLSADQIQAGAVQVMRNMAVWPTWTNTNFYTYLTRLAKFNQTLPREKRVRHFLSDTFVDWSALKTPQEYQTYRRNIGNRDQEMAQHIIDWMRQLTVTGSRPPKCLVIMNYRHAFDLIGVDTTAKKENTYEYLKEAFGSRAANVLLNCPLIISVPIAGGLWDEAFAATGNRPAGFDFAGSPFGDDPFDLYFFDSKVARTQKYKDVFTGFVFYNPADEQFIQQGIPGYFKGFEDEARRRAELLNADYLKAVEWGIRQDKAGYPPQIQRHLGRKIETLSESALLGLSDIGLVIGLVALFVGGRGKDKSSNI